MNIQFRKTESSRTNKFYISIMFAGGDADTEHPHEYEMKGITYQNYTEHLDEIEAEVKKYKLLKELLDEYGQDHDAYEAILEEHGKEVASLFENTPNDPQCDYQFKCYLDSIELVAYDESGNKYESYIR